MAEGLSRREAVRLAKEQLGDATPAELATLIEASHGLAISPSIVTVLLGSLREQAALDRNKARAVEAGERLDAEAAAAKKAPRRRRGQARRDDAPQTARSLRVPKACPACGGDYAFRGRKVITPEQGEAELVETKYRCKRCEHEWRVRVPAEAVGPLGAPKGTPPEENENVRP